MDLEEAMEKLKVEMGIAEAVQSVRDSLDSVVANAVGTLIVPNEPLDALAKVGYGAN